MSNRVHPDSDSNELSALLTVARKAFDKSALAAVSVDYILGNGQRVNYEAIYIIATLIFFTVFHQRP